MLHANSRQASCLYYEQSAGESQRSQLAQVTCHRRCQICSPGSAAGAAHTRQTALHPHARTAGSRAPRARAPASAAGGPPPRRPRCRAFPAGHTIKPFKPERPLSKVGPRCIWRDAHPEWLSSPGCRHISMRTWRMPEPRCLGKRTVAADTPKVNPKGPKGPGCLHSAARTWRMQTGASICGSSSELG